MVETNLPIIFLKEIVVLPYNELRIELVTDNDKLVLGLSESKHDNHLLLVNLNDPLEEHPNIKDLPKIAILGKVKSKIELPNGRVRLVIIGIDRVEVLNYIENENYMEAFVIPTKEYDYDEIEANALKRMLFRDLNNYIDISPYMTNNVLGRIMGVNNLSKLSDIIISELPLEYLDKLKYVSIANPMLRIRKIIEDLNKEIETIRIENEIEVSLKNKLESEQKEYVLREKIKLIKEELGDTDIKDNDLDLLREKINNLSAPKKIKERLYLELKRYELIPQTSPEISIVRGYIDWLLNLPWLESTKDNFNLEKARKVLDDSHYGLDKVKERIIEYIAVKKNVKNINSPIICLVGPPGVGKTSLAKSIAASLNKKFVKISVGGVNDESEIMGHRRTYIGANPGKIIQGLKKAGSNNPVFLIDEIDKLTKDYRGDPASALLDVLDREQNSIFSDNYIEEEFDLSNVMFILTANTISTIPDALRDRLEIIELSSYTLPEKISIAKEHIIPKLLSDYNLKNISFTDAAIEYVIDNYTMESGARELERQFEHIARVLILKEKKNIIIDSDDVSDYLGNVKYYHSENSKNNKTGVVNALAFTTYGGKILKVSVTSYKEKEEVILTGSLGDVMKESVYIALSYIKSNLKEFSLDEKLFKDKTIHFHFEEGSTPKDGPSAGVTIVTALLSLLKDKVIANDISMTGEITLRGKVLPIGGLKEKLIAASTNKIKKVYIPKENEKDLLEIDNYIKDSLNISLVDNYSDIYKNIFK